MMAEEWGPWIEHDGNGCPCVGMMVEAEIVTIDRKQSSFRQALVKGGPQWVWKNAETVTRETDTHIYVVGAVIRYRIRKPQALQDLIRMAESPVNPDAVPTERVSA